MKTALLCACVVFPLMLFAAPPSATDYSRIDIYVTPYYQSNGPTVNVGKFSSGLASKDEQEFVRTIHAMKQRWDQLTFAELYVAAIRLYDLGYRKESVYWFYTAQFRGRQFANLIDERKKGGLGSTAFELAHAQSAFFQLVGPYINAYAFSDTDALKLILERVQREGRNIGDLTAVYPGVAFKDRRSWTATNTEIADGLSRLISMLDEVKESIRSQRSDDGVEAAIAALQDKPLPPA